MSVNEKMTAIADAIRDKTGGTEPLGLDEMAVGVGEVYEAGKKSEYDAFWDVYQDNGNRTDYQNLFSGGGWTNETFKPKYDIATTNAYMMFRMTGITDLVTALGGKKITFNCTVLQYTFNSTPFEVLDGVVFAKPLKILDAAFDFGRLREIKVPLPIDASATSLNGFSSATELEEVRFTGTIPINIGFQRSTKLSKESIESVINALSTTASGKTVTFSKTAKEAAFIAEEWATLIATKSNWTISLV